MKIRELAKSNPEVKRWNDLAMAVVEGGLTDEERQEFWALDAEAESRWDSAEETEVNRKGTENMNKSLEEIKALRAENAALRNALGPAVDFILQVRPALWSRQGEASDLIKRGLDAMNGTSPLTQQDPL